MILKLFSPKNLAKKWHFWLKTKQNFEKVDHNIGIKNAIFFAENLEKSQKIVIITSTPGPNGNNCFKKQV
jgi:hypothetical protein